ncbi:MAG: biotin synthase BioB [Parachlamydiaceae bacterium]
MSLRHDWSLQELEALYALPLIELIAKSYAVHIKFHDPTEIQTCTLISVKTGGCIEDCKYCAQSSRYQTSVSAQPLMPYNEVIERAKNAVRQGATRICLGAAWREVKDNKQFDQILLMIEAISTLGVEVCCTLGMLKDHQAKRLKEAGLYAYNHNLDTSEKFYSQIITTRTFQDRLETLDIVEKADLSVCCGGILGMGETVSDRLEMLLTLAKRNPHPESTPINRLSPVPGTPLGHLPQIPFWEMLRVIAIARIILPKTMVRLSAGRIDMSYEQQFLCFLAGANSIFIGEKLLTVSNPSVNKDETMFELLGLKKHPANNSKICS